MTIYHFVRTETLVKTYLLDVTANTFSEASAAAEVGSIERVLGKENVELIKETTEEKTTVTCEQFKIGTKVQVGLSDSPRIITTARVMTYWAGGNVVVEKANGEHGLYHVDDIIPMDE